MGIEKPNIFGQKVTPNYVRLDPARQPVATSSKPDIPAKTYAVQLLKIRVIHPFNIKPRLWNLGPRTPTLGEEFPQLLRAVDIPSKPAAHANNGNRGLHRHQPFSQRALNIRLLQQVSGFWARVSCTSIRRRVLRVPGVGSEDSSRSRGKKGPSDGGNNNR